MYMNDDGKSSWDIVQRPTQIKNKLSPYKHGIAHIFKP